MGLFGPNRKKSLRDALAGMSDGTFDPGMTMDGGYDPSSDGPAADPSIGDVGGPPKKGFNWGRAAMGFFGGPGVVSALRQKDALELQQQKYQEQEQQSAQNQMAAYQWAKSHGYSDEDAKALAVHPDTVAAMVQANHAPQRFDSGGGSIYQDGGWTTAPRFDGDGNIYAPSQTAPGQQFKTPDMVQRGTKAIPVQPGGQVQIVDALTGMRPDQVGNAPQAPQGGNDEASLRAQAADAIRNGADPAAVNARLQQMLGGAGPQAPRPFFGRRY